MSFFGSLGTGHDPCRCPETDSKGVFWITKNHKVQEPWWNTTSLTELVPGINAGVILLAPSEVVFQQMLYEVIPCSAPLTPLHLPVLQVTSENHPAHIAGNGPEQVRLNSDLVLDFLRQSC